MTVGGKWAEIGRRVAIFTLSTLAMGQSAGPAPPGGIEAARTVFERFRSGSALSQRAGR